MITSTLASGIVIPSIGSTEKLDDGVGARRLDRHGIGVDRDDVVAGTEQVDQIPAAAAAGIEDAHPRRNAAAKYLIEEIDVDTAEVLGQGVAHVAVIVRQDPAIRERPSRWRCCASPRT